MSLEIPPGNSVFDSALGQVKEQQTRMMIKNVLEWLEKTEEKYPDKPAYRDSQSQITFRQVKDLARRIGSGLRTVQEKAPIAIISGRNIYTIASYLGIVYSGHAYAPIDAGLPLQRIETILESLKPSAILVDSTYSDLGKKIAGNAKVLSVEDVLSAEADEEFLDAVRSEMIDTDPLYVIFTSGSTGKPKGVITSHQSLMCYIESYADVMEICETDVLGNQSPLDYIAAIRDIYLPLLTGCTSVIIPREYFMEPNNLFSFMNQHRITSVGWSVSAFTIPLALGAFEEIKPESLKKICFSGSVMPNACLMAWQKNLPDAKFVNQYGPTEATASCTYYEIDHPVEKDEVLLIGKAYNHYRVFLLNEDLTETPRGEIGEICVSGPILALGYYNDPERTRASFIINPNSKGYPELMYRSGDYGRFREDGLLEFHGRKDRQIKHMGHRVELDEIEYAAGQIDGVVECASLYHAEKENIVLFYAGTAERKELLIALRKVLPGFMVPRKVVCLEKLPRLANGKIDMNMLKGEMENAR